MRWRLSSYQLELCQNPGVGRFDSRRWWTVLPLIPFTTPPNRGLRTSAFFGELQKAEFEHNVICKRTLAGLKAARARGTVYKQVGAVAPEK